MRGRRPQRVSRHVWYYEGVSSLQFTVETRNAAGYLLTAPTLFSVPVRMIRASLKRYGRTKKKGAK